MEHFVASGGNCELVYANLFTIENLPTRFSADRIDDSLPHYRISKGEKSRKIDMSNIQWIQRSLNGRAKCTRPELLRACLASDNRKDIGKIPDDVKAYYAGDQRIREAFDQIVKEAEEEEEEKSVVNVEHMVRLGWKGAFRIHHLVRYQTTKGKPSMLAIMRGKGAIPTPAEHELFKKTPDLKLLWFKSDKSVLESEVSDYKRAITYMMSYSPYKLDVK